MSKEANTLFDEDIAEPFEHWARRVNDGFLYHLKRSREVVEHCGKNILLAFEMAVDSRIGYPNLMGKSVHRQRFDATRCNNLFGLPHYLATPFVVSFSHDDTPS